MQGTPAATLLLVPLLGPLHLRMPRYNVETVTAILRRFAPDVVALTPLAKGALADPGWQDLVEIALPQSVVPWARKAGVPTYEVGHEPDDPEGEADFRRYLGGSQQGTEVLLKLRAAEAPVADLLAKALTTDDLRDRLLPAVGAYQQERERLVGEGPGTGWQRSRAKRIAVAIRDLTGAAQDARIAVAIGIDDAPSVAEAVAGWARLATLEAPPVDEAMEHRALLDLAMLGDSDDPASLLARLRELGTSEARYHQANLLLRHGHPAEARDLLVALSHTDFAEPYFLPGFVLSRLGQLHDLAGDREAALRCYRGVRALSFAPPEALAAAESGLRRPFAMDA